VRFLVLLLVACSLPTVPQLEEAGAVLDGGTYQLIVVPGSCRDAERFQRELAERVWCNTCWAYHCEDELHWFCKTCQGAEQDGDWLDAWGCAPRVHAWCIDLRLGADGGF
jgi:hypothetical protein